MINPTDNQLIALGIVCVTIMILTLVIASAIVGHAL